MRTRTYEVDVVFSTSIPVIVYADNKADAMEKAEDKAAEEFRDLLDKGYFGASDFSCEAQEP